eukprot:1061591-Amphidinium_carterae.1
MDGPLIYYISMVRGTRLTALGVEWMETTITATLNVHILGHKPCHATPKTLSMGKWLEFFYLNERELAGCVLAQQGWVRVDPKENKCCLSGWNSPFQGEVCTDGAAAHPQNKCLRRCSWAVVQLSSQSHACGLLPQRELGTNTAYEAEPLALVFSAEHAKPGEPGIIVHIDNAEVVGGAHRPAMSMARHRHRDLWLAAARERTPMIVRKIKAHSACQMER